MEISAVYPDAVNESASEWIELYLIADGGFSTGKDNLSWPAADLEEDIALRNGDGWYRLNNSGSIVERWLCTCTRQTNSMILQNSNFCHWDFGIRYCLGFRIWNLGFAGKSGNLFCSQDTWMQQLMLIHL